MNLTMKNKNDNLNSYIPQQLKNKNSISKDISEKKTKKNERNSIKNNLNTQPLMSNPELDYNNSINCKSNIKLTTKENHLNNNNKNVKNNKSNIITNINHEHNEKSKKRKVNNEEIIQSKKLDIREKKSFTICNKNSSFSLSPSHKRHKNLNNINSIERNNECPHYLLPTKNWKTKTLETISRRKNLEDKMKYIATQKDFKKNFLKEIEDKKNNIYNNNNNILIPNESSSKSLLTSSSLLKKNKKKSFIINSSLVTKPRFSLSSDRASFQKRKTLLSTSTVNKSERITKSGIKTSQNNLSSSPLINNIKPKMENSMVNHDHNDNNIEKTINSLKIETKPISSFNKEISNASNNIKPDNNYYVTPKKTLSINKLSKLIKEENEINNNNNNNDKKAYDEIKKNKITNDTNNNTKKDPSSDTDINDNSHNRKITNSYNKINSCSSSQQLNKNKNKNKNTIYQTPQKNHLSTFSTSSSSECSLRSDPIQSHQNPHLLKKSITRLTPKNNIRYSISKVDLFKTPQNNRSFNIISIKSKSTISKKRSINIQNKRTTTTPLPKSTTHSIKNDSVYYSTPSQHNKINRKLNKNSKNEINNDNTNNNVNCSKRNTSNKIDLNKMYISAETLKDTSFDDNLFFDYFKEDRINQSVIINRPKEEK